MGLGMRMGAEPAAVVVSAKVTPVTAMWLPLAFAAAAPITPEPEIRAYTWPPTVAGSSQ